jgi:hypothetical protein
VCAETIAAIEEEIDAATTQAEGGRPTLMRALLSELAEKAQCQWPSGRIPGLFEAPFLLAFVRQLQEQGWSVAEGISLPRAEDVCGELHILRSEQASAGSSHRRELDEQRGDESADPVRVLSCILARHASSAWGDAYAAYAESRFPLAHGAASRVGRLRAYGNAIVATQAAQFIIAASEAMT